LRLILGIGNPGDRYKYNRHNLGFLVLDFFASLNSLSFLPSKGDYYYSRGSIEDCEFQLIKPTTYVNNSGIAAKQVMSNSNAELKDLLVIHDDVNLPFPEMRLKIKGGDGGHNGISSLIYHLESEEFARIRIGIGNNYGKGELADYVLTDFKAAEFEQLEKSFKTTGNLITEFIKGGINGMLDANSMLSGQISDNSDKRIG